MRKVFLLILVFVCSVAFGQGEVVKKGQKALTRNAKILKAHYPWEYNEPSDWANIHYAKSGEALLLVNDSADRYIAFDCIVQSSGQYSVDVYGGIRADSLIYTQTLNTTVDFNYQMPLGKGKSYGTNGYDNYIIRIYPTLKTKKITDFTLRQHPSSTMADVGILLANINIPTLTAYRFDSPNAGAGGNAICMKYCNVYNCSNITTLANAFYQCTDLYTVTFPKTLNNVTSLVGAFSYCTSLHHIVLPRVMDNVTTVGYSTYMNYSCFANCTSLLYVRMPQSMKKATDFAGVFFNCKKLQYLYMPTYAPAITIMNATFQGCDSIKHIRLPMILNKVTSIENCCYQCYALEDIEMPISMNSVTTLEAAFYKCYKLKQLSLPDTLNSVTTMVGMFDHCITLNRVKLPVKMDKLQLAGGSFYRVFNNCQSLDSLCFPDSLPKLTTLQGCFNICNTLTYVKLPKYSPLLTQITNIFRNCINLKSVRFPDTLNSLTGTNESFSSCTSLDSLFLPKSATSFINFGESVSFANIDTISTCTFGTSMVTFNITIKDLKYFIQPTLKVNQLILRGASLATASSLHTIDIDWANSTYGGTSPQIDIRWNSLSATTINAIFTALPVVTGKTINVAGNPGSATCTPTIASLKGWTVIII